MRPGDHSPLPLPNRLDRRRLLRQGGLAVALLPLAACSSLVPASQPPALYQLTRLGSPAPTSSLMSGSPVSWRLSLEEPGAASALDTDYIALSPAVSRIEYYQGVRWASRLPLMLQTLLLETFEASGRIAAVGRQAIGLRSDYDLAIDIRDFQAEYRDADKATPPVIHLRLAVKMIGSISREITAAKTVEIRQTATSGDLPAIAAAFNQAATTVGNEVAGWVLSQPAPKS